MKSLAPANGAQPVLPNSNEELPTRFKPGPVVATVMVTLSRLTAPAVSVTVASSFHVPAAYRWLAFAEACGPTTNPSPKSNRYVSGAPSGSVEPEALAVTGSGSFPDFGVTASTAVGGRFAAVTVSRVTADPTSALAALNVSV